MQDVEEVLVCVANMDPVVHAEVVKVPIAELISPSVVVTLAVNYRRVAALHVARHTKLHEDGRTWPLLGVIVQDRVCVPLIVRHQGEVNRDITLLGFLAQEFIEDQGTVHFQRGNPLLRRSFVKEGGVRFLSRLEVEPLTEPRIWRVLARVPPSYARIGA